MHDHVSRPEPGSGEALVRVEAAALNFSDLLMIEDGYQVRPPRPFIPGQEIAGTVVSTGPATGLAVGERVMSKVPWGGFSEYSVVRADMAMPIPAEFSVASAAALPVVYTTTLVALTEITTVMSGETVLVLAAAGGIGLATVQIAHHLGAHVIAAAGGEAKCRLAREHGAHHCVDYGLGGWVEETRELTADRGVDVIVDPVGGKFTGEAMRLLGWGGRLLLVGFSSGEIPRIAANRLLLRRASALGVYWSHDRDSAMLRRTARRMDELLRAAVIRPHLGAICEFDELPDALLALRRRETTGKIVLAVQGSAIP
ncbi:NADPH:quinone oxidoreductase family protein [Bradyrhizobium sp.]|uniref:NADPH:quinone oxidoreductase family protein n=1 Tax=Bradyrhizobium sp. TaxID=376 RepID=UPI0025C055E7|nr:NADPH:quinone oxidoreductase family protein [Bradyrhizobium sp.]